MAKHLLRPCIGIVGRHASLNDGLSDLVGVRHTYIESITAAGGFPLIIPPVADSMLLHSAFERVDALLIPGGADVEPKRYGEEPHPKLGQIEPLRDETEISLIQLAHAGKKPILGICRGLQVMNVALGGSLFQDIEDQCPDALAHSADLAAGDDPVAHSVRFTLSSKVATFLNTAEIQVNSRHHQAIKQIAPGLSIVGKAPDGLIEAIESKDHPFFTGLQCHPEDLWQKTDKRWLGLFKGFVSAAREYGYAQRGR